jgi:hypothetical protein
MQRFRENEATIRLRQRDKEERVRGKTVTPNATGRREDKGAEKYTR